MYYEVMSNNFNNIFYILNKGAGTVYWCVQPQKSTERFLFFNTLLRYLGLHVNYPTINVWNLYIMSHKCFNLH